jgi:hypothetical protein
VNDHQVVGCVIVTRPTAFEGFFEQADVLHLRNQEELPAERIAGTTATRNLKCTNSFCLTAIEAVRVNLGDALSTVVVESNDPLRGDCFA